jgi:prepilin-type N-terminal cleavage/methylation domain-containing protein
MERLRAFTLLEITVAMLLTGVLATLAYGILGTFNSIAQRSFGLGDELQQVRDLQQALIADSDRAISLVTTADGLAFMTALDQARYTRMGSGLLRTVGEHVDTFQVSVTEFRGYWRGQRVTGNNLPVEQLDLIAEVDNDTITISITQHYDAITRRNFE